VGSTREVETNLANVYPDSNSHLDITARRSNHCGSAPTASREMQDA
jgi:hypothetical protein